MYRGHKLHLIPLNLQDTLLPHSERHLTEGLNMGREWFLSGRPVCWCDFIFFTELDIYTIIILFFLNYELYFSELQRGTNAGKDILK